MNTNLYNTLVVIMDLSIVVPAYNEEKRIASFLLQYCGFYEYFAQEVEVEFIIVINGSNDSTRRIVEHYAANKTNIRIVIVPQKCGKGGAIVEGVKRASGEYIGFADADASTSPEEFNRLHIMLKYMGTTAVIASRWMKGSWIYPKQPRHRLVLSRCFNLICNLLLKLRYKDTQCGAKILNGILFKEICELDITESGWAFDINLLLAMKKRGVTAMEVPTQWKDQPHSKLSPAKASIEMLRAVLRLKKK